MDLPALTEPAEVPRDPQPIPNVFLDILRAHGKALLNERLGVVLWVAVMALIAALG